MSRLEVVWSPTGSVFEGEGNRLSQIRLSLLYCVSWCRRRYAFVTKTNNLHVNKIKSVQALMTHLV